MSNALQFPTSLDDNCSTKEEMYRHLSIDIVSDENRDGKSADAATAPTTKISKASVESSLAHFFQPEVREIKCEKCEEGTHAEQTLHILSRYVSLYDSA